MIILVLLWLILAIAIGAAAGQRGRSGAGWFLLAVIISPLIAGLLLVIFPDLKTRSLLEAASEPYQVDDHALKRNIEGFADDEGRRTQLWLLRVLLVGAAIIGIYFWLR